MNRFFLPAVAVLLLAVASGNAARAQDAEEPVADTAAETMDAAYQALRNQEYDTAYDLFYSLAEQGNALAQYETGALYHLGAGVEADAVRAAHWYTRAAQQGYAEAQFRLGNMYMMGEGVPQSDSEALHWHEKAAQQGHRDAGRNLASLRRISAAKTRQELEQEAASLPPLEVKKQGPDGDQTARRGVFKRWFGGDRETEPETERPATPVPAPVATPGGNKKKGFFGRLFGRDKAQEQEAVGAQQAPETGAQGAAQAPAPLSNPGAVSNYELGMAYALGNTLEQDHAKAFEHFTRSAQEGYAPAQYRLGVAYANGDGTAKDPARAIEWYDKSAGQGYASAQRSLALIYLNGLEGVAPDKPLALAWYRLLAERANQMDVHRRDALLRELSEQEIGRSEELEAGIRQRLDADN